MAQRREDLRAADVDRQFVADRLKVALDEGRLSLGEYDDRLRDAYAARTYGDLDVILADLPGFVPASEAQLATTEQHGAYESSIATPVSSGAVSPLAGMGPLPRWLIGVWGAWLAAVSVNVVIWTIIAVSNPGDVPYFWPIWVAGPWGAVLLAITVTGVLTGAPQRELEKRARKDAKREAKRQRKASEDDD